MRKTLATIGVAAACLLGPTAAAHAATGTTHTAPGYPGTGTNLPTCGCHHGHHHGHHHGKKHGHGKPKPRPVKHHHHAHKPAPCPPPKPHHHRHHHPQPKPGHHHQPPSSRHVTAVEKPGPSSRHGSVAHLHVANASALPTELAFTGIDLRDALLTAGGLTGLGCVLVLSTFTAPMRRFTRQAGTR